MFTFVDHVSQLMWSLQGADMAEIRRQYRQLSLRYHPDKDTGNQDKFMKIAKAYEAYVNKAVLNLLSCDCGIQFNWWRVS